MINKTTTEIKTFVALMSDRDQTDDNSGTGSAAVQIFFLDDPDKDGKPNMSNTSREIVQMVITEVGDFNPALQLIGPHNRQTFDADDTIHINGVAGFGNRVEVAVNNEVVGNSFIDPDGKWSFALPSLSASTYSVQVVAIDDASKKMSRFLDIIIIVDPTDKDGDGIHNKLDTMPSAPSNKFIIAEFFLGEIIDKGGNNITVTPDSDNPDSVIIKVEGGSESATIRVPENTDLGTEVEVTIEPGSEIQVSFGSIMIDVISGAALVQFVTADDRVISTTIIAGHTVTFDIDSLTITADPDNPENTIIMIGPDETVRISPGETVTIEEEDDLFCNDMTVDEIIASGNYNVIDNRAGALGSTVVGTPAADLILGSDNGDQLEGKRGDDCIIAGNGNDTIFGGKQNDIIYGQGGADTIEGDLGDDTIFGDADNDVLLGEDGNDTIDGGAGDADSCDGGIGTNTILNCEPVVELFCDDMTIDELIASGNYNVIDNRDGSLGSTIIGTTGNDLILGSDNGDQLEGKRGDDCIIAGDGNDTVFGGKQNDTIYGQGGIDTIEGDKNDDTIFGGSDNDIILGETGNDTIDGGPGS